MRRGNSIEGRESEKREYTIDRRCELKGGEISEAKHISLRGKKWVLCEEKAGREKVGLYNCPYFLPETHVNLG